MPETVEQKYRNLSEYTDEEILGKRFLFTEGTSRYVQEGCVSGYSPSREFVRLLGSGLAGTAIETATGKLYGTGQWLRTEDVHILEVLGDVK